MTRLPAKPKNPRKPMRKEASGGFFGFRGGRDSRRDRLERFVIPLSELVNRFPGEVDGILPAERIAVQLLPVGEEAVRFDERAVPALPADRADRVHDRGADFDVVVLPVLDEVPGDKGQIVIPAKARKLFSISPGDQLVVLGDENQGLAIMKAEGFLAMADAIRKGINMPD